MDVNVTTTTDIKHEPVVVSIIFGFTFLFILLICIKQNFVDEAGKESDRV
jgi:hypothetical protein